MKQGLYTAIVAWLFCSGFTDVIHPEAASGFVPKKSIVAKDFIAVTAHPYATSAAHSILAKGGTAIDAAIAAQMVLNVVEPQASGIGGGGFLLYYDSSKKKTITYDGRETAPLASSETMFLKKDGTVKTFQEAINGGLAVGTPGLLKMLDLAYNDYGSLPWKSLFSPAISLAMKGFAVTPRLYHVANGVDWPANPYSQQPIGKVITNHALAKSLTTIATQGVKSFYQGTIAKHIVQKVTEHPTNPGRLSLEDLKQYKVRKSTPVCGMYQEYQYCGMGLPSSGAITILQALGILEFFDFVDSTPLSSQAVHVSTEAMKLAFADRNRYLADDVFVSVPVEQLLDPGYLSHRASRISYQSVIKEPESWPVGYEPPSTTHMSIIDTYGNAVSMTTSIEHAFGSRLMVGGFILNNQLTDFAFQPMQDGVEVANRPEPGKRPRSSMSPSMLFKDGELVMVLGSPGGARIIPYIYNIVRYFVDNKMDIQEAINLPHAITIGKVIELEEGRGLETLEQPLESKGHNVRFTALTSGIHAIVKTDKGWKSGTDPRREGRAMGN